MKSIIKGLMTALLLAIGTTVSAADVQIYTTDNSNGKITGESIDKVFKEAGFYVSGHNDMNLPFNAKFKKTNHKTYRLIQVYDKNYVLKLIKVTPKAAMITPLSMSIYADKGSNNISMSALSIDGMAKVSGISADNKDLIAYAKLLKETLAKALPNGHYEEITYGIKKPVGELTSSFTLEMDATSKEEIEEELEGIQEEIEGGLETAGFVAAGFNRLGEEFTEMGYDKYDFFDAYSICKVSVIYEVSRIRPEAGGFAPCTFFMYKEKGSQVIQMSYPSVYNWLSSLSIEDKVATDVLKKAQKAMVGLLSEATE